MLCSRGNGASVARIVPYAAIHFGAYEWYRQALVDRLAMRGGPGKKGSSPVWDLLAGSAAGGTAVLATYPLDLVRVLTEICSLPSRLLTPSRSPACRGPDARVCL